MVDGENASALPRDPDVPGPAAPATRRIAPRQRRTPPGVLAAIAAGGALGAPARYGVAVLLPVAPGAFPWATFWTNIAGSFLLGFALILLIERLPPTRYLRPFIATGLLGAFTTYSTFAVETDLLVRGGRPVLAAGYAAASFAAGLAAVWSGILLARLVSLRARRERTWR